MRLLLPERLQGPAEDIEQTKEIMKKAILHKGYALVDVFQPCVTYNKINTFRWFKENTYYLDDTYDPHNRIEAFKKVTDTGKVSTGCYLCKSETNV